MVDYNWPRVQYEKNDPFFLGIFINDFISTCTSTSTSTGISTSTSTSTSMNRHPVAPVFTILSQNEEETEIYRSRKVPASNYNVKIAF